MLDKYQHSEWFASSTQQYLNEVGKTNLLTREQERELAERIQKGDAEARDDMIRANLLLVAEIAKDFMGKGVDLLDLISEGNIGLMRAIERFDLNKGGKLSTYATWWIKQSMIRAVANQGRSIRLPVHMLDKIKKIRRIVHTISEDFGREPTPDEVENLTGISSARIGMILKIAQKPVSIHALMTDQGSGDGEGDKAIGREFGLSFSDEDTVSPFDHLVTDDLLEKIPYLLTMLTDREMEVIKARFGLFGQKREVLEKVGKSMEKTRERVRQIERQALRKMRRRLFKIEDPRFTTSARELKPAVSDRDNPLNNQPILSLEEAEKLRQMEIQVDESFGDYRKQLDFLLNFLKIYPDTTPNTFANRAGDDGEKILNGRRTAEFFRRQKNTLMSALRGYLQSPEKGLSQIPWHNRPILSPNEQNKIRSLPPGDISIDYSLMPDAGNRSLIQQIIEALRTNPTITTKQLLRQYTFYKGQTEIWSAHQLHPSTKVMLYIHTFLS